MSSLTENDSSTMKPDAETLLSNAEGEIASQAFTGEQSGLFSKKYLSGPSIYDRLNDTEAIHYLLVNPSQGVTIDTGDSTTPETRAPDAGLRSIVAVTDQRLLFVIGGESGDDVIELDAGDVTDASFEGSLLSKKVVFETGSATYTFSVKKRASSDPAAAVNYVQEHHVPIEPSESGTQGESEERKDGQNRTDSDDEGGSGEKSDTTPDGPESVFVTDDQRIASETRQSLRTAAEDIRGIDISEANLNEAIETLEATRERLQDVVDNSGVATGKVEKAIKRLSSDLERLIRIRSAISPARRKLALMDNGMQVSDSEIDELLSTIDEAIEAAEELERSSEQLEEYQNRLRKGLDGSEVRSDDEGGKRTATGTRRGGTPWPQRSNRSSTDPNDSDDDGTEADSNEDDSSPTGQDERDTPLTDSGSKESTGPSRDELIEDLQQVQERLGKEPDPVHVRKYGSYRGTTFMDEFGTWGSAFEAAFPDSEEESSTHETGSTEGDDQQQSPSDEPQPKEPPEEGAEPTRDEVVEEIERVAKELGKRPTTSEFDSHAVYDSSDVYRYFDWWGKAFDAADFETVSRVNLLSELHHLNSQLGFIPITTHIEEHGRFSPYDYKQEFGGVYEALDEAGFDLKSEVIETIGEVVADANGKPKMAEFGEASPYSPNIVYKYFDSWDDAVEAATPESEEPPSDNPVEQNELSERYELLRNLRRLVSTVVETSEERDEDAGEDKSDPPMIDWLNEIEAVWQGERTDEPEYGTQQNERNPFSMNEYREAFGNGNRVTEFQHTGARTPGPVVRTLLSPHLDEDLSDFYLPIDPETGARFPILVESRDELRRAVEMLERLPAKPSAASPTEPPPEPDGKPHNVNGVTDAIAQALQTSGYSTKEDLRNADMDDLAAVDGVSSQIAMRIKLDVGD